MEMKYLIFVVTISPKHDWFEVYATIARYGPIVDLGEIDGSVREYKVMFTLENTAKTQQLRSMCELDCGSASVPIELAGFVSDVPTEQPAASDGASPNILEHLNNDILCEIVESRALDSDDLCSIGSACVRFNEAAESAFRSRHPKHLKIMQQWPFQRAATVLRLFGDHIKSVDIALFRKPYADITLALIAFHCRNIERLDCDSLLPISGARARFERRQANGIVEAMPFGKLKSLTLSGYPTGTGPLPHMRLPSLRAVDMNVRNVAASDGTRQFFAAHPRIKRMRLNFREFRRPVEPFLLPSSEVEELELDGNPDVNNGGHLVLGQLQHLKVLKCAHMDEWVVRRIVEAIGASASVPLERLEYQVTMDPAVSIAVAKISSLKCIVLSGWQPDSTLAKCLTSMAVGPKLEDIRLRLFHFEFKLDDIRELLIKAPDQLKAVNCRVSCNGMGEQFLASNRSTIAAIDRMAKDRRIQLRVDVYVGVRLPERATAHLQQFRDWLIVW